MHRLIKNLVFSLVGIIVLAAAVLTAYLFLRLPDPHVPLMLDAVEMRSVGNNSVAKAKLIDRMDSNIERVKESEISDKWTELTVCLNDGCSDDALFDFVLSIVIVRPDKVPNAKLIADVIVAGRFWGSAEVLKFSKALSAANDGLANLNSKEIDKKWDEIIACDGKCPDKNALIFDEIKLIMVKGSEQ